ncbi:hypothetical protein Tco_1189471, partial [Tanacetum coccineum]
EGRTIDPSFYNDLSDDSVAKFTSIGFDCLLSLDEQVCPRFIFEFYKTLKLERNSNNHFSIQFIINNHHFDLSLAQFVELTHLPNQGICIYSDPWGLDELEKTQEQIEPYNSRLPTLDEQPNERTPSPPPRKKSLSPPQAPSKSTSSKSTHYTSSSSPKLPPPQMSPNDACAQTMDNWPPGPSNQSPPPGVSRPPLGFPNPPPEFEPLPSAEPLFVNINNKSPLLHKNAPPLKNIHHPPPNLGN